MRKRSHLLILSFFLSLGAAGCLSAALPIFPGADPHAITVGDTIWIYPTWNNEPGSQRFFAFSATAPNFVSWQRHGPILDFNDVSWIQADGQKRHFAWAPSVLEHGGKYYLFFSVGPQHPTPSRIGVALSDRPQGPFRDSGQVLITGDDQFEAIDPMAFTDPKTGTTFLYAGGSAGAKLRMFELQSNRLHIAREIPVETPPQFTEGAFMHVYKGRYYLSYSHGSWQRSSYSVHYATAEGPAGPWTYRGAILASDATRKGPGHHSFVQRPGSEEWLIVYHRWDNQKGDGPYQGSRQICIDRVEYDAYGLLRPVTMTGP